VVFGPVVFAAAAFRLAAIGIYGTISLLVAERTQEMGIRLALGADRPAILKLVLGQGLTLIAIGLTAGIAGAMVLTRVLTGLIYGIRALGRRCRTIIPLRKGRLRLSHEQDELSRRCAKFTGSAVTAG
jgi:ABC-type antimicrobial peptide transport system permease subunit